MELHYPEQVRVGLPGLLCVADLPAAPSLPNP